MKKNTTVNVLISVYKNIPFLKKVLDSVEQQTYRNFTVTIVEDGDSEEMKTFVNKLNYTFSILHLQQEDKGFRKNRILNSGLRKNKADLCIFIDGDCVLHPKFIYEYVKHYDGSSVLFSKRTNLDDKTTQLLLNSDIIVPSKWTMIKNKSTRVEDSFYLPFKPIKKTLKPRIIGCNMAIPFSTLQTINGFDEDFEITGYGEDCDIEWRILKEGFSFFNLKFHAVQFHLNHDRPGREDHTAISRAMYHTKKEKGITFCVNGLNKNDTNTN
jgi:cellulose synthase/poly-beta-1,6-N-acetylglucosamine synthase-like glycosyltransferase